MKTAVRLLLLAGDGRRTAAVAGPVEVNRWRRRRNNLPSNSSLFACPPSLTLHRRGTAAVLEKGGGVCGMEHGDGMTS